jgi:two-component sensor histidine kinase
MYQEIAATGSGTVETRWRRKDGVVIDVLLSSTLLVPGDNSAGVTFIALDITERKAAEEQMTASLRQKEILLQEIHHRVKNNLALVSSLLGLQALHLQNPELDSPFNESRERVHAMARLHDHLYLTPDVDQVAMLPYVTELIAELREAYLSTVTMIVEAGNVQLHMDQATPCGLILNELLTNALKHAFPPSWHGTGDPVIRVTFTTEDDHVLLRVQDNGAGLPGNRYARDGSMGCSLVEMLSRQLNGELEVLGQDGTCISVRFPQRHPVPGWGHV